MQMDWQGCNQGSYHGRQDPALSEVEGCRYWSPDPVIPSEAFRVCEMRSWGICCWRLSAIPPFENRKGRGSLILVVQMDW